MRLRFLLAALACIAFIGCLGDSVSSTNIPTLTTVPLVSVESTTFAPALGVNLAASTKTASGLYYRDITVGTGTLITTNHTIGVYYSGSLSTGVVFDSKLSPDSPYSFLLGAKQVIAGWDEGIVGMRIGGVRQLIIPATLAYGAVGNTAIPGNAVIVFRVEAVKYQ